MIKKTKDDYIIQEEKTSEPLENKGWKVNNLSCVHVLTRKARNYDGIKNGSVEKRV